MGAHFHIVPIRRGWGESPSAQGRIFVEKLWQPEGNWTCQWRNALLPGNVGVGHHEWDRTEVIRRVGRIIEGAPQRFRLDLYEITEPEVRSGTWGQPYRTEAEQRVLSLDRVPFNWNHGLITFGEGVVYIAWNPILVGRIRWNTVAGQSSP